RSAVSVPARCGLKAIDGYRRWVSPRTRTRCRYVPSCSAYGRATIRRYGLAGGSRLALRRIRRCTRTVPPGTPDAPP
ncbi:MAG: membrane protein insertion efficiency factor YidD, partial [Stackebrandtia sp.]